MPKIGVLKLSCTCQYVYICRVDAVFYNPALFILPQTLCRDHLPNGYYIHTPYVCSMSGNDFSAAVECAFYERAEDSAME